MLSKRYAIHSIFLTHQGEGLHVGKRAVFIRFTGCNVWSGLEPHRFRDAQKHSTCALICDTEFSGMDESKLGDWYEANALAKVARAMWGMVAGEAFCVLTGGEPGLQVDEALVRELRQAGFYVAIETNGTQRLPSNLHWISMAPKFPMPIHESFSDAGVDEVKLLSFFVTNPEYVSIANSIQARHRWVQPVDARPLLRHHDAAIESGREMEKAVRFSLENPQWRLGFQAHKSWMVA